MISQINGDGLPDSDVADDELVRLERFYTDITERILQGHDLYEGLGRRQGMLGARAFQEVTDLIRLCLMHLEASGLELPCTGSATGTEQRMRRQR